MQLTTIDHNLNKPSEYYYVVSSAIQSATEVIENSNSENSKKAFKKDLEYWSAWYQANNIPQHELGKKEHLILFIIQHAQDMPTNIDDILIRNGAKSKRGIHKLATIERRIATLSSYLRLKKLPNVCGDKDIRVLLTKLTNIHGTSKSWGNAITLDVLNKMLSTCENDGLHGIRDMALILFGFSTGGRRRSEISSAMLENITRSSTGNFIYNMPKSKTNQSGELDPKPLAGRAAIALMHWLEVANIKEGHLFRGIKKNGSISSTALSDKQIANIIKNRCKKAGFEQDAFTAHSLRSGFVTEGGMRSKPLGDIMAMTGHRNVEQVMKYYKTGAVLNNSAAYLAG